MAAIKTQSEKWKEDYECQRDRKWKRRSFHLIFFSSIYVPHVIFYICACTLWSL